MKIDVIRDPGPDVGGISIVIASNEQGRVEPFAFENQTDAESFAEGIRGRGHISIALVYHGVQVMNEFGTRRTVKEIQETWPGS